MTDRIDERSRRWDDFQGGRPIDLPDGQSWWFFTPEPKARSYRNGASGKIQVVPSWCFATDDDQLDQALAEKFGAILAKYGVAISDVERQSAALEATWMLLARNYNLPINEFERIMLMGTNWPEFKQAMLGQEIGELLNDVLTRSYAEVAL